MSDGLWFFVFKIDVDFFHQIVQAIGSISLVKFNFLVSLQLVQVLVYRVDNSNSISIGMAFCSSASSPSWAARKL